LDQQFFKQLIMHVKYNKANVQYNKNKASET